MIIEFQVKRIPAARTVSGRVTKRQAEVVELGRKLSVKDIALAIGRSENTVKKHLSRAYTALGAESRADAVALLAEQKAA